MDAILFGPPVYDNTIKGNAAFFYGENDLSSDFYCLLITKIFSDFALAFSLVMVLVLIVSIINQKRENKRIGDMLESQNHQINMVDWFLCDIL